MHTPQQVQLKQAVSCSDITERVNYIQKCVQTHSPVDMRQMVNLYRLAEMYNNAVHEKKKKNVSAMHVTKPKQKRPSFSKHSRRMSKRISQSNVFQNLKHSIKKKSTTKKA